MQAPPEILETRRLTLRRLRVGDAERIFEGWAQDPRVTRYLVWTPHRALEESVAHAVRCEEAWRKGTGHAWVLEERETGEAVGSIAAHPAGHRVGLGYLLKPSAWGRGFMGEAVDVVTAWFLDQPEIHRVWAVCDAENVASARVLERAGFQLEGTLQRWLVHPNVSSEPRDALCYAKVRPAEGGAAEGTAFADGRGPG